MRVRGGDGLEVATSCGCGPEVATSCRKHPSNRTTVPPRASSRTPLPPRARNQPETAHHCHLETSHTTQTAIRQHPTGSKWQPRAGAGPKWQPRAENTPQTAQQCHLAPVAARQCHLDGWSCTGAASAPVSPLPQSARCASQHQGHQPAAPAPTSVRPARPPSSGSRSRPTRQGLPSPGPGTRP